jgi:hypothetical protein
MRAIIHPWAGFSRITVSSGRSRENRIRPPLVDQRDMLLQKSPIVPASLPKFLTARINRLQASQIAAALLFDLGTVDIR